MCECIFDSSSDSRIGSALKHVFSRSICQRNSWASLEICQSMLRVIMRKHDIMPAFLETVRSFHDKTSNVEEAFGGTSWTSCSPCLKGTVAVLVMKTCVLSIKD